MQQKILLRFFALAMLLLFICGTAAAQVGSSPKQIWSCGFDKSTGGAQPFIQGYPTNAIQSCGSFDLYFEDIATGSSTGFADPQLGADRRNTFCAVVNYIESVLDLSNIPSTNHIRIQVLGNGLAAPTLATAANFYPSQPSGLVETYVHDFITTGIDPVGANFFHGSVNFGFNQLAPGYLCNNSQTPVTSCQTDLFSVLLHEMTHILGFYSVLSHTGALPMTPLTVYSRVDNAAFVGDPSDATNMQQLIVGGAYNPSLPLSNVEDHLWLGNEGTPNTLPIYAGYLGVNSMFAAPVSYFSHLDEQPLGGAFSRHTRVSPGNRQDFVMSPFAAVGNSRRKYSKGEIKMLNTVLGYNYNPTFSAVPINQITINNHLPYSKKMTNAATHPDIDAQYDFTGGVVANGTERLVPDFTITNDVGASLTINIAADPDITDPDPADIAAIAINPATLFNIRGCGQNGNNHNLLALSNGNKTITYTPRPNFYGTAQFGFTLTDGKENGGFQIYTIKVLKGNNVNLPASGEYILNGDFEEGTEVKRVGPEEVKPNSSFVESGGQEGLFIGAHLADSHPNDWFTNYNVPGGGGIMIDSSVGVCFNTVLPDGFGHFNTATNQPIYNNLFSAACIPTSGQRFQKIWGKKGAYYYLADSIKACHKYTIEMDVNGLWQTMDLLGFTTDLLANWQVMDYSNHDQPNLIYGMAPCFTSTMLSNDWWHLKMTFVYPSNTNPVTIFFIRKALGPSNVDDRFFLDNLTIKEDNTPPSVTVTDTPASTCTHTLTASPQGFGCNLPLTYSWMVNGVLFSTAATVTIPIGAAYTVSVTDGCFTATASQAAAANYFANTTATAMLAAFGNPVANTITTAAPITIDGVLTVDVPLTFENCQNITMMPNAKMVVNSGITLQIKTNTQISAACNAMWEGISTLASSAVVLISNSNISDMIDGVHTTQGAIITATGSTFTNNYISLWYEHTPDNYPASIYQNTFKGVGGLLNANLGPKARYGIYVSNSQYLEIGSYKFLGNTFDNLRTGVYIQLDNAPTGMPHRYYALNNQFQNIIGGQYGLFPNGGATSIYNDPDGTALFGINKSPVPTYCYVTSDYSQGNSNKIQDCTKGITLTAMSGELYHTNITNCLWGMNFSKTENYTHIVTHNTLLNVYYGMQFIGNPAYGYISDNVISSSSQSSMAFNTVSIPYPIGIDASFYTGGNNLFQVADNTISINSFAGVGLNLKNTGTGLSLLKNNITLTTNTTGPPPIGGSVNNPPLQGIALSNCVGSSVQGNHIIGTSAVINTSRTKVAGIYISKSPKLLLECNHVSSTRYGFLTISDCGTAETNVRGNTFQNHVNGMLFRHLGSEGTFKNIGNRNYDNNNSFSGLYAVNNGNFMKVFRMSVCNSGNPPNDNIYTSNGTLTANETGGNNTVCNYKVITNTNPYTVFNCPSSMLRLSPDDVAMISDIALAEQVAQDSVLYAEYQQGSSWISAQKLYYELWQDTLARGGNAVLDSFYLAMQNEPLADIQQTDELLKGGSDTLYAQDSLLYVQWLKDAEDANEAVVGTEVQVQNEAIINNLYLRYLQYGLDSFTTDDSATIADLALACPFVAGTAVYKARSLYSLYLPALSYDDLDICNNVGVYKGGHGLFDEENTTLSMQTQPTSVEKRIEIFPNPTSGKFTIHYTMNEGEQGIVELTDIYGRQVLTTTLHPMLSSQTINIGNQPTGIYFYRYFINGVQKVTGKLVLEK